MNNPLNAGAQFGEINPMPRSYQWNFGIQREVMRGTVVDLSYVGTRGNNLPLSLAFNPIPYQRGEELARIGTAAANQQARRLPLVGNLGSFVHAGTSSYHSLQVKAAKQFSRSFGWTAGSFRRSSGGWTGRVRTSTGRMRWRRRCSTRQSDRCGCAGLRSARF